MSGTILSGINTAYPHAVVFSGSSDRLGITSFGENFFNGFKDTFLYYMFDSLTLNNVGYMVLIFLLCMAVSFVLAILLLKSDVRFLKHYK